MLRGHLSFIDFERGFLRVVFSNVLALEIGPSSFSIQAISHHEKGLKVVCVK